MLCYYMEWFKDYINVSNQEPASDTELDMEMIR